MKKTLTLILGVMLVISAVASADPINLGNAKLLLNPNSSFAFNFNDGAKSHTEGDPQVHYKGRYFYWPAKTVVYVIGKTRIIGYAESRTGYTTKLHIVRPGKAIKEVNFHYHYADKDTGIKQWISKSNLPIYTTFSRTITKTARVLLWIHSDAPRIIWRGKTKGWEVRIRGKFTKMEWHKATKEQSEAMNPVQRR